jgi:hypothetical protein
VAKCGTRSSGKETVLHSFGGPDGAYPVAGRSADSAGNLYGTTTSGGAHEGSNCIGQAPGCGMVFKLANCPSPTCMARRKRILSSSP